VANGDIDSPAKARRVLRATGADALMIGRAAQGRPWIFREIAHFLATAAKLPPPATRRRARWLLEHLHDHYALYGERTGVRSARKHIGWAVRAARRRGLPRRDEPLKPARPSCARWPASSTNWPTPPPLPAANDAQAETPA
jgi:tRNA-dihydrouridine synthase